MNNLILGGAGFIGRHLTKHLFSKKERHVGVTVIDNFSTSDRTDIEEFKVYKNLYRFIETDLTQINNDEFLKIARKHDRIFFLAGSVGVDKVDKDPKGTLFNNITLAHKLIPLFEELRNRHVVFTSTSEIYGNGPFSEEDATSIGANSKLRWGYASSKLTTEFMIRASNFPYTIVRLFNVVGPGQLGDFGMVLPRFIKAALNNEDIDVYGTGEQIRSFCHVDDAVELILRSMEHPRHLFNIGSNQPIKIIDLARKVVELAHSNSSINLVPYQSVFSSQHDDIYLRIPDLSKIEKYTGYTQRKTLDQIILDMIRDR